MEYRVGDKIEILRARPYGAPVKKGKIGIVKKVNDDNFDYKVKSSSTTWSMMKEGLNKEFKIIESDYKETLADRLLRKVQTLKVKSLNETINFNDESIVIGCQTVSKEDALKIAKRIFLLYKD